LVTDRQQWLLDEYGIDIPGLAGDLSERHRRLALQRSGTNLDDQFDETAQRVRGLIDDLKPIATAIDSSLDKAVEAAQARIENELSRLGKKTIRAEKRNQYVILEWYVLSVPFSVSVSRNIDFQP